jgi:4-amino-4-deoxy-L-arabinose transferase-like glycosyltransferase
MGEVLQQCALGESDALLTFFVSASLLLWHIGSARRWPAMLTWGVAYLCVALAALTKGPQGPVYFVASVGLFLLITRQWRRALTWGHAFGIVVFCLVWGAWAVPFFLRTDFEALRYLYFGDVVRYGTADSFGPIARQLAEYPIRLFACLLPWSIIIATGYLRRDLRRAIGDAGEPLLFCAGAILITVPTVWWAARAETRFFIPLYPCFAVLFGIAFQRAVESAPGSNLKLIWRRFAVGLSIAVWLTGAFIAVAALVDGVLPSIKQQRSFGVVLIVLMLVLGALLWRTRGTVGVRQQLIAVTCVAVFGGAIFSGIIKNDAAARATDKVAQVARARALIRANGTLYSLDKVDHGFAYFYRDPIKLTPWPPHGALPESVEYFVFREPFDDVLPFAWEALEFVGMETAGQRKRPRLVVVARRVPGEPDLRPAGELISERFMARNVASAVQDK